MKATHKELLDRSVGAMAAAIEAYNKPISKYRAESFTILAMNAWELLLKAKWLKKNGNKMRSLYMIAGNNSSSKKGRYKKYRMTKGGNHMTHGVDYLITHLRMCGDLDAETSDNLLAAVEIRDSAVHLFNKTPGTSLELIIQELGMACVHNYTIKCKEWFNRSLLDLDTFLMPLAFVNHKKGVKGSLVSKEAKKFGDYVNELCRRTTSGDAGTAITINLSFKLDKRNEPGATLFRETNDPNAPRFGVPIPSEELSKIFHLSYQGLSDRCKTRIPGFRMDATYHSLRAQLADNPKLAWKRPNNPTKPNGKYTTYFSDKMFDELSKKYAERGMTA